MKAGDLYLKNQEYNLALAFYEEILVLDPSNKSATRKLAEATLGAYDEKIREKMSDNRLGGAKIELLRVTKLRDGHVAEIRIDTEQLKRFGIGEGPQSFKIVDIRPESQEVVILFRGASAEFHAACGRIVLSSKRKGAKAQRGDSDLFAP